MSLTKPILLSTPSFDATEQKVFKFTVQAGENQITANQLTIRNQSDNSIVYQAIQNTFKYEHILPADTLSNGEYYNATVIVLDNQGNQSLPSLSIQFHCYTTPTLRITNIPDSRLIANSSFSFSFEYMQIEGERLNSYVVNLYNSSQVLVSSSNKLFVQDGTPPYTNSYIFSGFEDNSSYYIEVVGETIDGATVISPREQFDVKYRIPNIFAVVELTNNCDEGYITVKSNIVLIDGYSNPDPPRYIDDKEIDVTGKDEFVGWNKGYSIKNNFLARGWFRKPNVNSTIAQFSNTSGQIIKINYMHGYENVDAPDIQSYLSVDVSSIDGMEYYIFSNYIDTLPDNEYYNFQLAKVDDIYRVKLIKM